MDPLTTAAVLLAVAVLFVWLANRPDRSRLSDTRERRRMGIEHDRHRCE